MFSSCSDSALEAKGYKVQDGSSSGCPLLASPTARV